MGPKTFQRSAPRLQQSAHRMTAAESMQDGYGKGTSTARVVKRSASINCQPHACTRSVWLYLPAYAHVALQICAARCRWNRVFSQAVVDVPAAGDEFQVHQSDISMQGVFDPLPPQQGLLAPREGSLTIVQQPSFGRHSSFMTQGLGKLTGALSGQPKWWHAQQDGDRAAPEPASRVCSLTRGQGPGARDCGDSSTHSTTVVTGGDVLLLFNSTGGSTTLGVGHTTAEAAAHATHVNTAAVGSSCRSLTNQQHQADNSESAAASIAAPSAGHADVVEAAVTAPAYQGTEQKAIVAVDASEAAAVKAFAQWRLNTGSDPAPASTPASHAPAAVTSAAPMPFRTRKNSSGASIGGVGGISFAISTANAAASGTAVRAVSTALRGVVQKKLSMTRKLEGSSAAATAGSPGGRSVMSIVRLHRVTMCQHTVCANSTLPCRQRVPPVVSAAPTTSCRAVVVPPVVS